jgi:hypothetical protein
VLLCGCDQLFGLGDLRRVPTDANSGSDAAGDASRTYDAMIDAGPDLSLIAWYPLEGTAWEDATGHGHDGTCVGACPASAAGRIGNAAMFNMQRVNVPGTAFIFTNGFTVALWVYRTGIDSADGSCLINKLLGTPTTTSIDSWQFCVTPSGTATYLSHDGASFNTITAGNVPTGAWHHYALTWSGSTTRTKKLWVDGTSNVQSTTAIAFDTALIIFGADQNNGVSGGWYYGLIDDVRIYNRVLTATEIQALAAM